MGAKTNGYFCRFTADVKRVDSTILAEVCDLVDLVASADTGFQAVLRRAWRAMRETRDASDPASRIHDLEAAAGKARTRLTRAAELFVDGQIDKTGYEGLRDKAEAELQAIHAELERIQRLKPKDELPALEVVLQHAGGWAAALRGASVPQQREVLALLIEGIVPTREARGRYRPQVSWTPLGDALRRIVREAAESSAA